MDLEEYIDDTIECKEFRFDNVFGYSANDLDGVNWSDGKLEPGNGSYKENSAIIMNGGGEIESSGYKRTTFLGTYPTVPYEIGGAAGKQVDIYFYTMDHGYLGHTTVTTPSS